MTTWKTKWGWRAEFVLKGERIGYKGFFKYKDEARQWVKDERERLKNQPKSSFQNKDLSLWSLSQKYLSHCKVSYTHQTFTEKKFCLKRFYEFTGNVDVDKIEPFTILEFINNRAKEESNNASNKDRKI